MTDLPLSTSDITQEVKIRMGEDGQSSIPTKTVMQMFDECMEKNADKPALHQKKPKKDGTTEKEYTTWTFKEYRDNVNKFAKALISIGFEKFDCVNIIGFNSPEWMFADLGTIAAGGVPAGIYSTNLPDGCQYICDHAKAKVVVCEGIHQLSKFYTISQELPNLKALVMYGPDELPSDIADKCPSVPVHTFEQFLNLGKDVSDETLKERSDSWKPGEVATLIYTSGTTGPPKAAMITNDNITWLARTILLYSARGEMDNTDHMISYLPLSHIAAQVLDIYIPLCSGCQIHFAKPDALKGSLGQTLKEVRPTTFFGVPRVYEKIYDKLQEVGKATTGIKKILSTWAKGQAEAHWEAQEFGSTTPEPYFFFLAEILLAKVKEALGFDRCQSFHVGAAPIDKKILKYFSSINIVILENFGQSESTGPHSTNKTDVFKLGTCGRPILGTETKIDPNNGEMCFRGRHVFAGYKDMPDKTSDAIDADGWLHTGDVIKIDDDHDPKIPKPSGFVSITGRIKELIITAGGENIPPVLIEEEMKKAMPALANCMVIGDKRKFLSILLCLTVEIDGDGVASNKLTGRALEVGKEIGSSATTTEEVALDDKWKQYFDKGLEVANSKATSRAQKVNKWTLVPTDFTEKGTELTPTLKLKRSVTEQKYNDLVEAMYA